MADKKKKKEKTSKKVDQLIEEIGSLSVLELADLVSALEDKFGVSAVAAVPTAAAVASGEGGASEEEKSSYTVVLQEIGDNKIALIKAVREINPNLGLKEAKELVESAPAEILEDVKKEEAEGAAEKLREAGGKIELK
ncbi:MAG: 50S ribosomal protein L7/L12 [Microgenomates bacterium 39_6]|nr:MAG: 50S ribosomal protein L7/L12 [Microgenomates bacterium 39_6]